MSQIKEDGREMALSAVTGPELGGGGGGGIILKVMARVSGKETEFGIRH